LYRAPAAILVQPGRLLLALVLAGALGCGDENQAPTSPEASAALASASAPLDFFQVSAGNGQSCGITVDNRLFCWGRNDHGQVGDGSQIDRLRPTPIAQSLRFRLVSAGDLYTCAVTTDYHAFCWGWNYGALGDGTSTERHTPVRVVGKHLFRQLAAGVLRTCGVTLTDRAFCWGDDGLGGLGDGGFLPQLAPVAVKGGLSFRQVDPGHWHTCGITLDNRAYCWGGNEFGQVGDGTRSTARFTPVRVAGTHQFRQISAGGDATCAVTTSDVAFCWGHGLDGQLGSGNQKLATAPRAVVGGLSFTRVTVGEAHTCGEAKNKRAYCWGVNANGQLGDGSTVLRQLSPVPVAGGLTFAQLSAGGFHTCGKTVGSLGYCWGVNFDGTLGDGTTTSTNVPVAVVGPS
jgi:alpha-tubulin suppressor-like RCC1 family protein